MTSSCTLFSLRVSFPLSLPSPPAARPSSPLPPAPLSQLFRNRHSSLFLLRQFELFLQSRPGLMTPDTSRVWKIVVVVVLVRSSVMALLTPDVQTSGPGPGSGVLGEEVGDEWTVRPPTSRFWVLRPGRKGSVRRGSVDFDRRSGRKCPRPVSGPLVTQVEGRELVTLCGKRRRFL